MSEFMRSDVMIAFAVMTAVTVASRLGGYWLMGYVTITPRVRRMLDALPGSIIVAASLPVAVNGGAVVLFAIGAAIAITIIGAMSSSPSSPAWPWRHWRARSDSAADFGKSRAGFRRQSHRNRSIFLLHCEFESRLIEMLVSAFELVFISFWETNAINGLQANSSGRLSRESSDRPCPRRHWPG